MAGGRQHCGVVDDVLASVRDLLLPAIEDVAVTAVETAADGVRAEVRSTATGACCPGCGGWSGRVHGSYLRFPADTPTAGRPVVLRVRVRRFACVTAGCTRRTFRAANLSAARAQRARVGTASCVPDRDLTSTGRHPSPPEVPLVSFRSIAARFTAVLAVPAAVLAVAEVKGGEVKWFNLSHACTGTPV
ncbi:transposase family protein, partial [Streptodolium elevatio]|uniref:transposase family protein n=1 Tax=Streptodolium elevatio TaxID=3157996 RepID=UPI003F4D6C50